jgi:hypothetical protein
MFRFLLRCAVPLWSAATRRRFGFLSAPDAIADVDR